MKPHVRQLLVCGAIALASLPFTASAAPVPFSELSLMVRSRESDASISHEVSQRKLAQKLNADQEATLKKQGASDSLISTLRNAAVAPDVSGHIKVCASAIRRGPDLHARRGRDCASELKGNDGEESGDR